MIEIHPTAVVHPTARLGDEVKVGPYAVVGELVAIGAGSMIGPHAIIDPFTSIGENCQIFSGAVVGGIPQDLKFTGEESYLTIGDHNVIRECVTINRATGRGEQTRIGNGNLFMAYVHIAHNCIIGNHVILANGVTVAGHVEIEDYAIIGGLTGLHQFIRVGTMAMVGAMSRLAQDVPPYMLVQGSPPKVYGPNSLGLRRNGLPAATRDSLKKVYRLLYRSNLNLSQAIQQLAATIRSIPEIKHLIEFLERSQRGIIGLAGKGSIKGTYNFDS
ncbi:MAG: acyl-ACP--UDP-N-acetylglucosamine O-acyltransferase [Cyanobacteria bacterium NC_groundwater_1444_Ag_S-0.65um_54_12]|nr:acyl-ACP--UDP-N-acetylglucosamine O-acyltransferase [Cyanobacteria bacterium NC_groundwater_1444_Ag_S-0.65um_54_12]